MNENIINQLAEDKESYFNAAIPPIFSNSNFLFSNVNDMREAMSSKLSLIHISEPTRPY